MKRWIVMVAAAALVTGVPLASFAAGKTVEDKCKAEAEKHKVAADKLDAYVKECVEKHMKHQEHAKSEKKEAPKAEAPAAPAKPAM